MKTELTEKQYNSLVEKIYESLWGNNPDLGLGEVGEMKDESERIVSEWMEENNLCVYLSNGEII